MNNLMTVHKLGSQLIALLGLPKHCVSFELRCAAGELVRVKCKFYPEEVEGIDLVLSEYELVPHISAARGHAQRHRAAAIGFDAWLRERTEVAHQTMMKHSRSCRKAR